jgi:lysophospholipase L1-like esterase
MKRLFIGIVFLQLLSTKGSAQNDSPFIRRLEVAPLSILQYGMSLKVSNQNLRACSWLRFYDSADNELLKYKSNTISSTSFKETGIYTEAPPFTKYVTITVGKDSPSSGTIEVNEYKTELNIGSPAKKNYPLCDLDQYMRPFWNSDTIYNETVLLLARNGAAASGNLLFTPTKILSVKSFDLSTTYSKKDDFILTGRTISRRVHSKMSFRTDRSFPGTDLAWYNLQSQWIVVTYTHRDKWKAPAPAYKGEMMPGTIGLLKSRSPLHIVAYGMSITRGLDVSSYDAVPPYMPNYVDLFTRALKKIYGYDDICLSNAALPGARADWGADYAEKYINPLKPDLVIIDFGMNDFWAYKPEEYKAFIQTIINKVKAANPEAEFLLLSNMKFDPDYILGSDKNKSFYVGNLEGYSKVLQQLETKGIINLDMTSTSGFIYARKKAKDCISNPLHPNDYMARWYAQAMAALFKQ